VLLYPGFGLVGFYFALSLLDQESVIGVVGLDAAAQPVGDVPALVVDGEFNRQFADALTDPRLMRLRPLTADDTGPLDDRQVDAVLVVPADLAERVAADQRVTLDVRGRDGDELSKLAVRRVSAVLERFQRDLKAARFARKNLPPDFDQPLLIKEPRSGDSPLQKSGDELRDVVTRMFPFMLVMWSLAGALHPAIDLCAGEKERGTMETLLISPAERLEIVAGKFLAVWAYSSLTAAWNLLWLSALCLLGNWYFDTTIVGWTGLAWCFALVLPLAALFSALCLAIGVYARSTKEGQYYLLPLFLAALPLVFWSLLPGTELNFGMSLVPVTGVCLLLHKLMGPAPSQALPYLLPVLVSLAACVAASAWWAVRQFHREDVLFRESDASALRGWLAGFGAEARP
jgi:sodium transport system permease protein